MRYLDIWRRRQDLLNLDLLDFPRPYWCSRLPKASFLAWLVNLFLQPCLSAFEYKAIEPPTPRSEAKTSRCKRYNPVMELTTAGARGQVRNYGLSVAIGLRKHERRLLLVDRRTHLTSSSHGSTKWLYLLQRGVLALLRRAGESMASFFISFVSNGRIIRSPFQFLGISLAIL